tara:strand:+ start:548 stop:1093 length:546 start_codon:yes stop_codon:yes gene_type:complete
MKIFNLLLIMFSVFNFNMSAQLSPESFYDIEINSIEGELIDFNSFKGKKVLIVNVASFCGFTRQYKALEKLSNDYKDNLVVLGVPCNQFGGQEPNDEKQIQDFCEKNYGVSFLLSEKVDVKGSKQHPLYQWLSNKKLNGKLDSTVKWNFQKYIIDENGQLLNYFLSTTSPTSSKILSLIEQ